MSRTPKDYTTKFEEFIKMCDATKQGDTVIVDHPEVLGDTYEELVESLSRIAKAKALLAIARP